MSKLNVRRYGVILCAFMALMFTKAYAYNLPVSTKDFASVDEAVVEIQRALKKQGYTIPLVVNHAAAAASVGLTLRPTQVIFARQPKRLERRMLHRSDTLAIDLPIKVLVFEDESGTIQIRDNAIGYLIDRHQAWLFDPLWYKARKATAGFSDTDQGLVSVVSDLSVEETVSALQEAISANPAFRIPLVVNFCNQRWEGCPQLVVFGNPNAGTPLMQANQAIGIDLPQKFLVSHNDEGEVIITYNDPIFFAKRHNIQGQDARLSAIANALANFANQGAGNPSP